MTTNTSTHVTTDDKFKNFLVNNLGEEIFEQLSQRNDKFSGVTFLVSISTKKLSPNILILIEQFLNNVSFEEASTYVNSLSAYHIEDYFAEGIPSLSICSDAKLMRIIIKYVNNINYHDAFGYNALMNACLTVDSQSDLEKIKLLLEYKIDANATTFHNWTALMFFCASMHTRTQFCQIASLMRHWNYLYLMGPILPLKQHVV